MQEEKQMQQNIRAGIMFAAQKLTAGASRLERDTFWVWVDHALNPRATTLFLAYNLGILHTLLDQRSIMSWNELGEWMFKEYEAGHMFPMLEEKEDGEVQS